jgi:hypothetical protein
MAMTIDELEKMHKLEHYREVVRQVEEAIRLAHDDLVWELRNGGYNAS